MILVEMNQDRLDKEKPRTDSLSKFLKLITNEKPLKALKKDKVMVGTELILSRDTELQKIKTET